MKLMVFMLKLTKKAKQTFSLIVGRILQIHFIVV